MVLLLTYILEIIRIGRSFMEDLRIVRGIGSGIIGCLGGLAISMGEVNWYIIVMLSIIALFVWWILVDGFRSM